MYAPRSAAIKGADILAVGDISSEYADARRGSGQFGGADYGSSWMKMLRNCTQADAEPQRPVPGSNLP